MAEVRGTHESLRSEEHCCFFDIAELDLKKKIQIDFNFFPLILRGNFSSYLVRQELKVVDKSTE